MFKIDRQKWLAAVAEVVADRDVHFPIRFEAARSGAMTYNEYRGAGGYRNHAEELTLLHSIKAMSRGKVHRKRARLTASQWIAMGHRSGLPRYEDFTKEGGTRVLDLGPEEQETYIGLAWMQYEAPIVVEGGSALTKDAIEHAARVILQK
jgi:hypothetical protein